MPRTNPNFRNGWQVRHDYLGWYLCTDEEGEHEDAGHPSVGFDGRDHWPTLRRAQHALRTGR